MEAAFPTDVIGPVKLALVVTVAAFPDTDPVMVFVTVRFKRVPTEVREEAKTVAFSVAPVKVPAAAVTTMLPVPSKDTVFMVLAVCKAVAVDAFPVSVPVKAPVTVTAPAKVASPVPKNVNNGFVVAFPKTMDSAALVVFIFM